MLFFLCESTPNIQFLKFYKFCLKPLQLAVCSKNIIVSATCRSSRLEVFCKIGTFKNFAKFTRKHLCQSLFFNKVVGQRPTTLLKETMAQVFSCESFEFFQNTFFYRTPPVAASELATCKQLTCFHLIIVIRN